MDYYEITHSEEFIAWFGNWKLAYETAGLDFKHPAWKNVSKAVNDIGQPLRLYHGTTHEWTKYSRKLGNHENDMGIGFYATSDRYDAQQNYLKEGKDITGKVAHFTEELSNKTGISTRKANKIIKSKYIGDTEKIMEVFLKLKRPVIISTKGFEGTNFDFAPTFDGNEQYEYSKTLIKFKEAFDDVCDDFDLSYDVKNRAWGEFMDNIGELDYISAYKVIKSIKGIQFFFDYLYNEEIGGNNVYEFVSQVFQKLRFDGVIYLDASEHFHNMDISRGTKHVVAFKPNQIKLADGTNTEFSTRNADVRFDNGGEIDDKMIKMENEIVDMFYDRIKLRLEQTGDKNHPSVQRELNRVVLIHGKTPSKIQELLDSYDVNNNDSEINNIGGYNYTESDNKIAEKVDLITLPKTVEGTNCSNCMYAEILDANKGLGFCKHKDIQLPVTARMCCSLWDAEGALRSWENKMFDCGGDVIVSENVELLPLTIGKFAIVDKEDFDFLNQWKWRTGIHKSRVGDEVNYYGQRTVYTGKLNSSGNREQIVVTLGKQILEIPFEKELRADYINGNNLDCRKSNLRIATVSQINIGSTGSLDESKKTSKYIGVSHKHDSRRNADFWRVSITPSKGEPIIEVLYPYTDEGEIESAKKYDELAKKYYGEFAKTNFKSLDNNFNDGGDIKVTNEKISELNNIVKQKKLLRLKKELEKAQYNGNVQKIEETQNEITETNS